MMNGILTAKTNLTCLKEIDNGFGAFGSLKKFRGGGGTTPLNWKRLKLTRNGPGLELDNMNTHKSYCITSL